MDVVVIFYGLCVFNFFLLARAIVSRVEIEKSEEFQKWVAFKKAHGRNYDTGDDDMRFQIFKTNLQTIKDHNTKFEQGLMFYQLDVNQFADITKDEFMQQQLTLNKSRALQNVQPAPLPTSGTIPEEVDWRKSGAVTNVKDQRQCGSCWSFSATGSLEGQHFKKSGSLVSLSEQNLIDCSTKDDGCNGGWMTSAFDYIKENGIHLENDYTFEGTKKACRSTNSGNIIKINGYHKIKESDEEALKEAVAQIGPISVAVDASNLQLYSGGMFTDVECSKDNINHGVLIVGYGKENGRAYWIVKNSWGTEWGEDGYFKIARNEDNHCGVATHGVYPVL